MGEWGINGVSIITPDKHIDRGSVTVKDDIIEKITEQSPKSIFTIESDGVLSPGLINSHDHLLGTYYPKVGNGPYENWLPWDNDLKSAPVYEERQQIDNKDLYLLGGYRNLLSGVTSVSDHIPHFVNEPFLDLLPTKVIRDYALAHSVSSFALAWGDGITVEYQKAIKENIPFITHIAEGFDDETVKDVSTLDRLGGLGDHSVLVHGLAFSDDDIKLIKKRGATVVWCGDSNTFMFNTTARVKNMLDEGVNVCIGTDSPMSGGLNLLFEMKFDREYYSKTYGEELPDEQIVKMVTVNPSRGFWLQNTGILRHGNLADLVIFRKTDKNPYTSVVNAEIEDIELIVINGRPMFGNAEHSELFEFLKVPFQEIEVNGEQKIVVGDLKGLLRRISKAVGFKKEFPFLPVAFEV